MNAETLVSIGLPVRNAGRALEHVVRSVLSQNHDRIELIISDNASTDDTEEVCRDLARADGRITYHRQPENVGILNNFVSAMRVANGPFFRWIGDDDRLEPDYVTRCLGVFDDDPRLILVTTGIAYTGPHGTAETAAYDGAALRSEDPIERFTEMLRLLNASYLLIDPLYGLMRRDVVMSIPRRNMLREDEVFAAKLALAGPWGHVRDVLAHRHWKQERIGTIARRLGVPSWQSHLSNTLQAREILAWINHSDLTNDERARARRAVYRLYTIRQQRTLSHRSRKLVRMATGR
jgi:glycosyltransferase involved in cell wall biosynthesis